LRFNLYIERDDKYQESVSELYNNLTIIHNDNIIKYAKLLYIKYKDKIIELLLHKYEDWWTHLPFQISFLKAIQQFL